MKLKKKIFTLSTCLLILGGMISSASAYYYVYGTEYQQATFVDIPGAGQVKFNMNYGSKKATTSEFATFVKVKTEALLGNFAALVTSSKKDISNTVSLSSYAKIAELHGASKGNIYFAAVCSSSLEPSNTCDVTLKFSADNLK